VSKAKLKGKNKASVRVVVVELSEGERLELQQFFLDKFVQIQKFAGACRAMKNFKMGGDVTEEMAQAVVGQWVEEDPVFKVEFEKAKRIVARIGAVKAEEFLNEVGSGKQRTGKDSGISTANVVGAHMVLEADDKAKWSSKVAVEKTETRTITTIVKHYGAGETKVETIDAPEVKLLPQGENGNSDEE
jgi:hypothetical protein